jgi:uncharacterized protein YeaO (DUF488 family)
VSADVASLLQLLWRRRGNSTARHRIRQREEVPMIRTKSVWSPINRKRDGLRVLVSRFRGRGMPSGRYDIWMPNLGPSEALLRSRQTGKISWAVFGKRYRDELFEDGLIDKRNQTIKNHGQKFTLRLLNRLAKGRPVTLMCHCAEDEPDCHRHLLKEVLRRSELAAK